MNLKECKDCGAIVAKTTQTEGAKGNQVRRVSAEILLSAAGRPCSKSQAPPTYAPLDSLDEPTLS